MKTKEYIVEGMTCNGCVAGVTKKLEALPEVEKAQVTLDPPLAIVDFSSTISFDKLQHALGKYKITEQLLEQVPITESSANLPEKNIITYKPLLMIVGFILGVSILAQSPFSNFDFMLLMRHFMAGFFIVFSFFKLLNIAGFADSYSMYDIVAKKWKAWGFIYPFVELGLGIAYLINFSPMATNIVAIIVMSVSAVGVIESNINKRQIKCACLGDVFNLPMSTVTIVEDVTMILMAAAMLFLV